MSSVKNSYGALQTCDRIDIGNTSFVESIQSSFLHYKDITPLLENVTVFHGAIEVFASHYRSEAIDKVVGIDARGFILDAALAYWNHHEPECNVYIPIQLKLR